MLSIRLSESGPLTVPEIAAVALALAREVDRLHAHETIHGHIRPSRVTLTDDGVELDPPDGVGFSKPHDVRSIGELTIWLLTRSGLRATGALADVARAAAALEPGSRPTAAQLVRELERVAVAPESTEPPVAVRRVALPLKVTAVAAAALAAFTLAAVLWDRTHRTAPPAPAEPAVTASPVEPPPPGVAPLPAQVWPEAARACSEVTTALRADLDGDGCDEELRFDGERFTGVGGAVAVTGVAMTHYATGDWNCDGTSELATLDAASGAVFVFPRWARPGEDVEAVAVAHVAGASGLIAADRDGDGCDELRAVTGTAEVEVDVPAETQG
jgi:hypothetical protein